MSLSSLQLKPLRGEFAAEARGIRLSQPLTAEAAREIERAMDRFAVLVWRDQPLSEEEQLGFARNFGTLDLGLNKKARKNPSRFRNEEIIDISNVTPEGGIYERAHSKTISTVANQFWHSDSSFQKPAAKYSMLSAVVVPGSGGQTEFADLRAAYDALAEDLKREIENLQAEHYAWHSRLWLGDSVSEQQREAFPPVQWPLVRRHAGSGRKHLFLGIHCTRVAGMTLAEGRMLLADLLEHATQRQFVYRHEWRAGDLVMWDNRCTVHRGRRFDLDARRELRRATTQDLGEAA
jgi:alpha-ketoglutarate-dependent 2,4-dichlorophenoxyacetate dioxygenase